uniref:Integrin alpha-X-like n=1 Tax=Gouania willdenowi TaxID=441366 RepID=A0A8C5D3K5_GOUWI
MVEVRRVVLLSFTVAAAAVIPLSLAFNIDLKVPKVYIGEPKEFFGYKVLQFNSGTNKGIIISSPLQHNGSGGISRHNKDQSGEWFNPNKTSLPKTMTVKHFGLSIAADSTGSHFTVCSPSVVHECHDNSYLNSVCFNISDQLQQLSLITPSFQECTKKTVDLVFLFDGSKSMTTYEFNQNKIFIQNVMTSLQNTSIKFAAVQFSTNWSKVFDFNDYKEGQALALLEKEVHLRDLTNTHKALRYVMNDIIENPSAGASPDATKVVVLITDGDPSDPDRDMIIKKYDEKNVIRFVIGVKDAKLDKFRAIASEPKDQNAFKIENYGGLKGMLENFQKKIFNMEGSAVARAGNITNEMSQSGFSAAFYKDRLILGSVGSNNWQGCLYERQQLKEVQIQDPEMEADSYMGYAIAVGERDDVPLYFAGAPRSEHKGRVVLFGHEGRNWIVLDRVNGEQIGSYFGAELCSLDVNSDGNMDFLLVGAPLFYQHQEKREGRLYVYTLNEELLLKSELNVSAPSMGRFGTTVSSLADLNGDGLRDVAVGAPMEDDNRGVVYIYLGERQRGIREVFSQRIMGGTIQSGMRLFGQSISGDIDLENDGLPDVVVGSKGTAVVLRSKPVINVVARLTYDPEEISTEHLDCLGTDKNLQMVSVSLCFEITEMTRSNYKNVESKLNISYTLDIIPTRQKNRGFFMETKDKTRNLTSVFGADKEKCFSHHIFMPNCVTDTLTPVTIKLDFSQVNSENALPALNMDSIRTYTVQVPFKKECRGDVCIAELEVDFIFTTPTLVVREGGYFNVSVKLSNNGDDSYNTSLTMLYAPGLSFSRMVLVQSTRRTFHSCKNLKEVLNQTTCGVSLPVYRSRSSATFNVSFLVLNDYEWNDTVTMTIEGKSDNVNSTVAVSKNLPVQFEVRMALTVPEDSVTYLNFTSEDSAPKQMVVIYRIDNTGFKDFPVNVYLTFPTKLQHGFEINNYQVFVQQNKTKCTRMENVENQHCLPENSSVVIKCDSFVLKNSSAVEFTLLGDVHFRDLELHAANISFLKRYTGDGAEVKFKSFMHVEYDTWQYVMESHKHENPVEQTWAPLV